MDQTGVGTYKPLFVALKTFCLESLDGHYNSTSWFSRSQSILIYPPFKHTPKPSLSKQTFWPEIPCGRLQIAETKGLEAGGFQKRVIHNPPKLFMDRKG